MQFDPRLGGRYVPPLGDLMPGHIHSPIPFKPWWMTAVLRDTEGDGWSRRRLVDALANQEGGAHVDPTLNESYIRIAGDESLGYTFSLHGETERPFQGDVAAASMRQIAYEMLETLRLADIK